ncbi:hypothetical protein Esti_004307 [Eimeria stiedai]
MAQVAAAHAQVALPPAAAAAAADGGALEGKEGKCFSGKTRKITHINDHYEIGKKLGSGYTATVYEATCKETARQVALKDIVKTRQRLIATDDYYRLVYEVLTRLPPHRHLLLPPLALLETSTHFYIVMELCHGRDLVEYVLKHPPGGIPTPSCQRLMQQLLLGVHFLHSHNILHRDIKLDNIIFRQSEEELGGDAGQGGDLALLDFDMCLLKPQEQQTSSSLSSSTEVSVVGTREYMAPECFKGQYSTASDIWSLGVILYILLDGHFPFDVNACNASSTPPSPSPAHESQQQQQNMFSGRAIRRLLRQGVQFFSGMKNKHPVATDLIEKMLKFDVHARMQTAFDALHHPWLLPVPSPVPRQQQHQQQQRSSLLPLQQGALPPSKDAAAAAPWPLPSVSDQQQQQQLQKQQQLQQQQQLLLLHHREAHCWGPSSMLPPLGLSRSDASGENHPVAVAAATAAHFLRQQMARRQQLQQQQRLPQLRQHQQQQQLQQLQQQQPGAATAAAHPLIEGTRIRRTPLAATAAAANAAAASAAAAPLGAASVAAGSPCKEVQVHRHFQQQRQPFISRHPCSVSSPQQQQQQLQHSAICDSSTPPRSSIQGAGPPPPLGGPGASQQQTPATQQPQQQQQQQQQVQQQAGLLQEQACMRRQPREQQKCLLHLPHAQSHKMREGATQGLIPGSAVSTRLPSSLPPSSQPNDFLGQVPLSPSSRYPSSFRAAAAAAAATAAPAAAAPAAPSGPASVPAAACTQSSFTPYSSATTSASCSKPSTPTLDSLPPRREDAIVAAAVAAAQLQQQLQQQQQQLQLRSAGVQRTVSRPAAVSGVSLVVQLQQRLQQQQQQQQLAQLQNRRFILQQQLQHHLLQQHITRRSSLKSAQAAESSLHADCAKAQHAPPQSSSNSRGSR